MSYIETPVDTHYPWYVRALFAAQRRRYGKELEPARLWGRTPGPFLAMAAMHRALNRGSSPLDPALRSLVQVRVSQINGCAHCVDINSAVALERGLSEEKLKSLPLVSDPTVFDERERAALEYAEAMTDSSRRTDPALIARLRQHFSDDGIIELTALIAFQNMSSKFNAALGIEAQGFCTIGDAGKPPTSGPAPPVRESPG
ncbi:MAG: carboxymuconolactone decarboxylase family protein [Burkholderiales bacterium]